MMIYARSMYRQSVNDKIRSERERNGNMSQRCKVCLHPERAAIDKAIIEGVTMRNIGAQYGMSEASVQRHKNSHLAKDLVIAQEAKDITSADSLMSDLTSLKDRAERILATCEENGDLRTSLGAIKELRNCIELLLKVSGELKPSQTVNISIHPEWLQLQTVIFQTLDEFPMAKSALIQAIGGGDDNT